MKHVFVESNWVFACCAPRHLRTPAAEQLRARARDGELALHLPAICLREGAAAIRQKCQPRVPEELRRFMRTARGSGALSAERAQAASQVLDLYSATVNAELRFLEDTLEALRRAPGVEAFALSEAMLERALQLRPDGLSGLKPFDEAILAAILVRAEALRADGAEELSFCTTDSDLQPWDRQREAREPLKSLYERADLWVYGDFTLTWPSRSPLG